LSKSPADPDVEGGGDPEVLPVPDHLDAFRVCGLDFQQGVLRLPPRPVVHDEDPVDLRENPLQDRKDGAADLEGDDDAGHRRESVGGRCDVRGGLHVANPQQLY
jgi:hypothetical protein